MPAVSGGRDCTPPHGGRSCSPFSRWHLDPRPRRETRPHGLWPQTGGPSSGAPCVAAGGSASYCSGSFELISPRFPAWGLREGWCCGLPWSGGTCYEALGRLFYFGPPRSPRSRERSRVPGAAFGFAETSARAPRYPLFDRALSSQREWSRQYQVGRGRKTRDQLTDRRESSLTSQAQTGVAGRRRGAFSLKLQGAQAC